MTVSRRIGHGSAAFTLRTYAHLLSKKDTAAAAAIEAALRLSSIAETVPACAAYQRGTISAFVCSAFHGMRGLR